MGRPEVHGVACKAAGSAVRSMLRVDPTTGSQSRTRHAVDEWEARNNGAALAHVTSMKNCILSVNKTQIVMAQLILMPTCLRYLGWY